MKHRILPSLTITLLLFLNLLSIAAAQDDPIEMVRQYPPNMVKQTDIAIAQMQWRLIQLTNTVKQQEKMRDEVDARIAELNQRISKLSQELPIELRFANDGVRADLIGDVLRELLASRLDLATRQAEVEQLQSALAKSEKEPTKIDGITTRKNQLNIQAAEEEVLAAKLNYERKADLAKRSVISSSELEKEKRVYELAKMQLEHALLDFELEKSSRVNDIADRVTNARIDIQPALARVQEADRFLKLFSDSHDNIRSIGELNRMIASLEADREQANRSIWTTKEEVMETELLLKLTTSKSEAAEKSEPVKEKE